MLPPDRPARRVARVWGVTALLATLGLASLSVAGDPPKNAPPPAEAIVPSGERSPKLAPPARVELVPVSVYPNGIASPPPAKSGTTPDPKPNAFPSRIEAADSTTAGKVAEIAKAAVAKGGPGWERVATWAATPTGTFAWPSDKLTIVECPSSVLEKGKLLGLAPDILLAGVGGVAECSLRRDSLRAYGLPIEPCSGRIDAYAPDGAGQAAVIVEYFGKYPKGDLKYNFATVTPADAAKLPTMATYSLQADDEDEHHAIVGKALGLIEFSTEGSPEVSRYALAPGIYEFVVAEKGWDLRRKTYKVTIDNTPNDEDFSFILGDRARTVAVGLAETVALRYASELRYARAGGGLEPLAVYKGVYNVAKDARGNVDLKPAGGESPMTGAQPARVFLSNLSAADPVYYTIGDHAYSLAARRTTSHPFVAGKGCTVEYDAGPAAKGVHGRWNLSPGTYAFRDVAGTIALNRGKCGVWVKNPTNAAFNLVCGGQACVIPARDGPASPGLLWLPVSETMSVATFDQNDRRGACVRALPGMSAESRAYEIRIDEETGLVDLFPDTTQTNSRSKSSTDDKKY